MNDTKTTTGGMTAAEFCARHNACDEGRTRSDGMTMREVWDRLCDGEGHFDWLMWVATRPGVLPDSTLRRLACAMVRRTPLADGRTVFDLLTDERSRNAIAVAERHADGAATDAELAAAGDAAWAAWAAQRQIIADVCGNPFAEGRTNG